MGVLVVMVVGGRGEGPLIDIFVVVVEYKL